MLTKAEISLTLRALDHLYRHARTQRQALLFSKLAILELCGWTEEAMDSIVHRCARGRVLEPANLEYIRKKVVQRTHGFDYERHFREMLIKVAGLGLVERLEQLADPALLVRFRAVLSQLKTLRDVEAHTHLKGVTRQMNAPSVTRSQFPDVYQGLREIERAMQRLT